MMSCASDLAYTRRIVEEHALVRKFILPLRSVYNSYQDGNNNLRFRYWYGRLITRPTIVPIGLVPNAETFDSIASVDVGTWIPYNYRGRTFVDASLTQFHIESQASPGTTYIFCHEAQFQASPRRVNMPLRRVLSKNNLRWYGNVLVLKTDFDGAIVDVALADLPFINAAAIA